MQSTIISKTTIDTLTLVFYHIKERKKPYFITIQDEGWSIVGLMLEGDNEFGIGNYYWKTIESIAKGFWPREHEYLPYKGE